MHYPVIKNSEFDNIITWLLDEVPSFSESYNYDPEDGEYLVFADFMLFIRDKIANDDQESLEQCFDFINKRISLPDHQVKNLIEVQIFEPLLENEKSTELAKGLLKGAALQSFKSMESQAI